MDLCSNLTDCMEYTIDIDGCHTLVIVVAHESWARRTRQTLTDDPDRRIRPWPPMVRVTRAKNRYDRRSDRRSDMHGASIGTDVEGAAFENGRKRSYVRLAGKVDGLVPGSRQDYPDQLAFILPVPGQDNFHIQALPDLVDQRGVTVREPLLENSLVNSSSRMDDDIWPCRGDACVFQRCLSSTNFLLCDFDLRGQVAPVELDTEGLEDFDLAQNRVNVSQVGGTICVGPTMARPDIESDPALPPDEEGLDEAPPRSMSVHEEIESPRAKFEQLDDVSRSGHHVWIESDDAIHVVGVAEYVGTQWIRDDGDLSLGISMAEAAKRRSRQHAVAESAGRKE